MQPVRIIEQYKMAVTFLLTLFVLVMFNLEATGQKGKSRINANYQGKLTARPQNSNQKPPAVTGEIKLDLYTPKNNLLYVPLSYTHEKPAVLAIMLHGAGGNASRELSFYKDAADTSNMIIIAPSSLTHTWDVIVENSFGGDVETIDLALLYVFKRYNVDTTHIVIGGFSDGASYALSLGLQNGNLFTHVLAHSPGFIAELVKKSGSPPVFISHGKDDTVLPIATCGRKISKVLTKEKYRVEFVEFKGGHEMPVPIKRQALQWLMK
jgi:phospholipase/carboxylesterase